MAEYVEPPPPAKDIAPDLRPWVLAVAAVGPGAQLAAFIASLPAALPAAVLAAESPPARRGASLAEHLRAGARLSVVRPYEGERLRDGVCYAPDPDQHIELTAEGELRRAPTARPQHAADQLLTSAARFGPRAVGVLLGPAAADGADGLAAMGRAGGRTLSGGTADRARGRATVGRGATPEALAEAAARLIAAARGA